MKLYSFQSEDVEHLRQRSNVLCANDPGTGKTYEAIALDFLRRLTGGTKTLVVAPLTILPVWLWHFKELTDLKVRQIDPKHRDRFLAEEADVYLLHYDVLRKMPELQQIEWLHIIADECHRIQNRRAQQTKALKALKARFKTGLSGTPVTNTPDRLWSVLNWLEPKEYSSYWRHFAEYVDAYIDPACGQYVIRGPKNEAQLLGKIQSMFIRRLKADVLPDLPPKTYTTIPVELYSAQRKAYDSMRNDLWSRIEPEQLIAAPTTLAALTRLQQFADAYATVDAVGHVRLAEPSAKLDVLMDLIEDSTDQLVVFTQYSQMVDLIEARLIKAGVSYCRLTGNTAQHHRGTIVEDFQQGRARIFVGTIGAGGVGITLTAASRVIFVDRTWSPADNAQAEDRLHRIGQPSAVGIIDLLATNTVEHGRLQRLEIKANWLRQLLGD